MMRNLFAVIVIAAIVILLEVWRELHRFVVTEYQIESPKLGSDMSEKKIVFLSDLHNHEYGKNNCELVEKIRDAKPDLILVSGDMLVGKPAHSSERAATFMKQLPEIAPVYYANGNHEQRMRENQKKYGDEYWKYKEELDKAGIIVLENDVCRINWGEKKVAIYGLEIPIECYFRTKRYRLQGEDVATCLGEPDMGEYNILLAHHPEFAPLYKDWGADLILSGHLHGGIARIPGIGGVISPQAGLFPKYSGECRLEGNTSIVVSKGLGTHTINLRFWNPAEMIVLHIKGKNL